MNVRKLMTGALLGVATTLLFAFPAAAQMGATVKAGFTDLPLRTCEGTYAGIVKKLPYGQQLRILWDNKNNWAEVEVAGTGERGWVNLENTMR
ncbi:MAG: SH3 domain-containing protein [Thermodesulfobacteriota bacterium]